MDDFDSFEASGLETELAILSHAGYVRCVIVERGSISRDEFPDFIKKGHPRSAKHDL